MTIGRPTSSADDPCYGNGVTARHAVLVVAALAVLGLGVYLFIEVRAEPATVMAPPVRPAADAPPTPTTGPTVAPITVPATGKVFGRRPPAGDIAEPAPALEGTAAPTALGQNRPKPAASTSQSTKAYERSEDE